MKYRSNIEGETAGFRCTSTRPTASCSTSDRVFVVANGVQNSESFYVAASRAKCELEIFTDSPDNLKSIAMESMSNRNPRELLSDLYKRQTILKAQKQHGVGDRSVL
jgi:ATP-dependent exoDNAse (exonuclease V) alpha subunit